MNKKLFYGWYIAVYTFFTNFMVVGSGFYIFNAFMEPLCIDRGWTRTDVNVAIVIGMFFGIFSQLIYGTLVVRIGPRILMTIGPFVSGIAFICLFRSQELIVFYLFCMMLFAGNGAYGGIVSNTVVNNWFIDKRGQALGISTTGVSFSGAILPFVAMLLILKNGIVGASLIIGCIISILGPLSFLIIRNWPEDYGLKPDGESGEEPEYEGGGNIASTIQNENDSFEWTLTELIHTATFWKLGLTYGMVLIGIVGVMSQLKPRFVDVGFDDKTAMAMMATTAFIGAIGKYVWGTLCDRFEPRKIISLLIVLNALGLSFSLIHGSLWPLVCFIVIFGFAMGGVMATYPIIIAHLFGRKSFPLVMKYLAVFFVFQLAGFIISGQSFDRTGSYDLAYMIYIFLYLIALLLMLTIRRPQKKH